MGFFQQRQIRKFNYRPVFYDERKEALKNKMDAAEKENAREYVPGASIKGSFKRMEVARKDLKYTPTSPKEKQHSLQPHSPGEFLQ